MTNQEIQERESELIEQITSNITDNPAALSQALTETIFTALENTDETNKKLIERLHVLWMILQDAIELKNLR